MWITGLIGMASEYSETFLSVRYRVKDSPGNTPDEPQRYLERGVTGDHGKFPAWFFAIVTRSPLSASAI